jgi:hypothetical protein
MVEGVRKLTARMTSATSRAMIEDFEREVPGCIGRQGEIWWLLRGRCPSGVMEDVVQRGPEADEKWGGVFGLRQRRWRNDIRLHAFNFRNLQRLINDPDLINLEH